MTTDGLLEAQADVIGYESMQVQAAAGRVNVEALISIQNAERLLVLCEAL